MDKEFLDLTRQNADDEEVENAIIFEDEWADINEEAWEFKVKRRMKPCIKIKSLHTTKGKKEQRSNTDNEYC